MKKRKNKNGVNIKKYRIDLKKDKIRQQKMNSNGSECGMKKKSQLRRITPKKMIM